MVFCAFDLLMKDGESLLEKPLEFRKAQLVASVTPPPPSTLYVGHFESQQGKQLFESATELKLEGLVAKRVGSTYKPRERSVDWVKIKRKGAVPGGALQAVSGIDSAQ